MSDTTNTADTDARKHDGTEPEAPALLSDEQQRLLKSEAARVMGGFPRRISVGKNKYLVRQISKGIRARINALELEAYMLSGRQKDSTSLKTARKMQRRLDSLHAKTAAYYLLGNKAVFIPGLFWLTWRRLMLRGEDHSLQINNAAVNDDELNFSSANWEITSLRLALSMRPIGDGVRDTLKRWEAAREQSRKDAMKKTEEKKSGPSSRKAGTTRR